jgi:hypothetical protein
MDNRPELKNFGDIFLPENSMALESFIKHCVGEFSLENIGFLYAVNQYRVLHPGTPGIPKGNFKINISLVDYMIPQSQWGGANTAGRWLYDTYITVGSPKQVNIKGSQREKLEASAKCLLPQYFDDAYVEVGNVLRKDSWTRFKM